MTLEQVTKELDIHFSRIDAVLAELKSYLPLKVSDFQEIEKIKTIDFFIYRFTKVQDRMGEKLFPIILKELHEYKSSMSLIDVLHRLEKLELLDSSDTWIDYRKLRNTLTHEYPDNEDEMIESITLAIEVYENLKEIYSKMLDRV
jgi:hypothetical protein